MVTDKLSCNIRRCPPCQAFTPKLAETYTKMKAAGKEFEIIFASSDSNQEKFE